MNKYEQLQSILNKCIEKWRLKGSWIKKIFVLTDWVYNEWGTLPIMSYHSLFSVDSWIFEYVNRKPKLYKEWHQELSTIKVKADWYKTYHDSSDKLYHLMMMWLMTAEEKIDYFLNNITDE